MRGGDKVTYNEITQILKSMVIIVDDREKDTPLLHQRLSSFPCAYMRKRLDFGDYSAEVTLPDGEKFSLADKVVVERKMALDEICGNFTTNRVRFAKEFDRAAAAGAKTYILIENGSWEKIHRGAYRSKMTPASLLGSLTTWLARYNCQIIFCEPDTTSWLIHAFLLHEMREALTHYELPQKTKRTRKGTEDDIIT